MKNSVIIILLFAINSYTFTIYQTTGLIQFENNGEEVMPIEGETLPIGAISTTYEGDSYIKLTMDSAFVLIYPQSEIRTFQDSSGSTILMQSGKILLLDPNNSITVINDSTIIDTKGTVTINSKDSSNTEIIQISGNSLIKVPHRDRAEMLSKGYRLSIVNKGVGKRSFSDSIKSSVDCEEIPCQFGKFVGCEGCPPINPLDTITFDSLPLLTIHPFSLYGVGVLGIKPTEIPKDVTKSLRVNAISDANWVDKVDYSILKPSDANSPNVKEQFVLDGLIKGEKDGKVSLNITLYSTSKQALLAEEDIVLENGIITKSFITDIKNIIENAFDDYKLGL